MGALKGLVKMDIKEAVIEKVKSVDNVDILWIVFDFLCGLLTGGIPADSEKISENVKK